MNLFEWLGFKKVMEDTDPKNVIKFPAPKAVPPVPEVQPPKEEPAKIFYRFGITDNNRLAFQMGYSELTMNRQGVQNLIDQLEFFKTQLSSEENDDN